MDDFTTRAMTGTLCSIAGTLTIFDAVNGGSFAFSAKAELAFGLTMMISAFVYIYLAFKV